MKEQSGIRFVKDGKADSTMTEKLPEPVQRIYASARAGLGDMLLGAFDAIDDSLFELANNARSNNDQNRYFETMREVRIKRKGMEKRFQEGLRNLFRTPPPSHSREQSDADSPQNADSLSLVQNDELEQQVAINAMISKAEATYQGPLLQLQTRFTSVYPDIDDNKPVNPLAPEHLCHLFVEVCKELDIEIRERLIVLKHFDRYVIANLGALLDEANRVLVASGVMPDFRYRGHTHDTVDHPQTGVSEDASAFSQTHFLEEIHSLLASTRQRHGGGMGHSGSGNAQQIDGAQLYQMLSELPRKPVEQDLTRGQPEPVDLHSIVRELLSQQSLSDGRKAELREMDEDLIDLVSMLFEFILEDYNLSPPIQVLVSRLQIPILKVVIKDRSFFNKPSHPARKLLNGMARAGIGWSESSEKNRDRLYHKIHDIVLRILNEFEGDIALFETLNEEFEEFLTREDRKSRLVEQRTQESERGRIKSQKAQETVDQMLQNRLARRELPESIRNILLNGWSRVMFLAYLRDDTEHRWSQSVRAVDDLLWCLRPLPDGREREQWVRVVPALLKTMRSGLEEVSYNASRLDEMMDALKHELTEAFRRQAREAAQEDEQQAAPTETEEPKEATPTAVEREQELESAAMSDHLETVDALTVGNWVEFSLVNGSCFRCKLSAIIEEADCYVFVNRMGLKVAEKHRMDLAHELRRGRLRVLEQGALIDRALGAIAGSLSRKAG